MTTDTAPATVKVSPRRTDPRRDVMRLVLYSVGLVAV